MFWMNVKMAWATFRGAKIRTLLTMLGIIIGVTSVVTIVSLGEGVKNQVADEINRLGNDLIQITPGKSIVRDEEGNITNYDFAAAFGTSTLSEKDLETIRQNENVAVMAPFTIVTGSVAVEGKPLEGVTIMATTPDILSVLNTSVQHGQFLDDTVAGGHGAVVGKGLANDLLHSEAPLGRKITIRGQEFTIVGVMEEYKSAFSNFGPNLNNSVYIPFNAGKEFNQGTAQIQEIDLKVKDANMIDETAVQLTEALKANHGGEEDFTVLKQEELVSVTDSVFGLLTSFVAAIASISLIVGGIGIMNIMLVAVSERTREIGIRKAIGATNAQIRYQFLIEAVAISIFGGLVGVALSYIIGLLIAINTDLTPAISPATLLLATGVSSIVGVVFGLAPAIQASRKDPIEALRHE